MTKPKTRTIEIKAWVKCDECDKWITCFTRSQADYLLKQHKLAKHKKT